MSSSVIVRYKECRRNHAISVGLQAVDGCREFMTPAAETAEQVVSGGGGDQRGFLCAACGCHRNFHRKEIIKDGAVVHYGSISTTTHHHAPSSSVVPMYVVVQQPVVHPPNNNVFSSYYNHQNHDHGLHGRYNNDHHHMIQHYGSSGANNSSHEDGHGDFEQKPNISFMTGSTKTEPF
ncbi:hypothetical protein CsatB_028979 [Cannabis sativa]|uniref:zinc-finger homeodomain protein 2-like n=1 Tax=Cannabis sativa TaxID=3483 RepID=UPI0029CA024A|nr:zinc-finger homeodomain protein 2-like [Cannabis sativa]